MSHPSTKAAQMHQIISLVRAQLATLEKEHKMQENLQRESEAKKF
jgi:hypothetical protein